MNEHDACKICFDEGIKVYPVIIDKHHQIEYSKNGVIQKRYTKILDSSKKLNEAMQKTYIFIAKQLQEKKLHKKQ